MPYESADLRRLAREPHLESLVAAMSVGHLGIPGGVPEAAGAARAAPPGPGPGASWTPQAAAGLQQQARTQCRARPHVPRLA